MTAGSPSEMLGYVRAQPSSALIRALETRLFGSSREPSDGANRSSGPSSNAAASV